MVGVFYGKETDMDKLKRIVAGIVAFIMTLSPLQATLTTFATAVNENKETPIEEISSDDRNDQDEGIIVEDDDNADEETISEAEFTEIFK